ncbi:DgyrCDS13385 [Dimorphilus gyrociliatus]|uniref:DgyrCDS13385 n=1 Tax=Dimorphilus gyrociliatus TaxID=2664684 RepID=A0A7I8WAH1_9ANNE|nr:DgyrCDS13385 [Dimorphilus gyrociliatus]
MKKFIALAVLVYAIYSFWEPFDPENVNGKNVVLTGATSGIGEQMAYEFAKLGANLIITARRENRLREVIAKCKELNPNAQYHYFPADMSNMEDINGLIKFTKTQWESLDYLVLNHILVHNLGWWIGSNTNATLLNTIMDTNFKAYVTLSSGLMSLVEKASGRLVVMNSVAGKIGQPYLAAYSASKFALNGFFQALGAELKLKEAKATITNCIIGLINTENAVNNLKNFGLGKIVKAFSPATPQDWPCYPGTYADTNEHDEGFCRPCPRGFYQPYYTRDYCLPCYYNMFQLGAKYCASPPAKKFF